LSKRKEKKRKGILSNMAIGATWHINVNTDKYIYHNVADYTTS
jgi:hypothetical protein